MTTVIWIAALILASDNQANSAPRQPNVLLLFADDLGAGELGCYGNPAHATPVLDQMARAGARFETCWSCPLCTPSRVMLMTGRYASGTGWYAMFERPFSPRRGEPAYDLGQAEVTFADLAKEVGYVTAMAGKWQLPGAGESLVRDCGFDQYLIWAYKSNLPPGVVHAGEWENEKKGKTSRYWHPSLLRNGEYLPTQPTDYGPDLMTDFLIDFIKRNRDRPWLVYYPMCNVHPPLEPTPDPKHPDKRLPGGLKTNVEYMDHLVGRLLATVDELGLGDETYVIFVGDNGTAKHGKGSMTELGVRVPLLVRGPGVKSGLVCMELASLADLYSTIAEVIGAPVPSDRTIDGQSLLPALHGEAGKHRPWVLSYLNLQQMIRDDRWLLEGSGKLFDTKGERTPGAYVDVTDSKDPEIVAARNRLRGILAEYPGPVATARQAVEDDGEE